MKTLWSPDGLRRLREATFGDYEEGMPQPSDEWLREAVQDGPYRHTQGLPGEGRFRGAYVLWARYEKQATLQLIGEALGLSLESPRQMQYKMLRTLRWKWGKEMRVAQTHECVCGICNKTWLETVR